MVASEQGKEIRALLRKLSHVQRSGWVDWIGRIGAARRLAELGVKRALPRMLASLDEPTIDPLCFSRMVEAIVLLRDPAAVPALLERLPGLRRDGVAVVLKSLEGLAAEALPAILEAARAEHPVLRGGAIRLLGVIDDPAVPAVLLRALEDSEASVRFAGAVSLGLRAVPEAVAPLRELRERSVSPYHRRVISLALTHCGYAFSGDGDPVRVDVLIQREQWKELIALGASALPALLQAVDDPEYYVRSQIVSVMAAIGDPRVLPRVKKLFVDPGSNARHAAAKALGVLGDETCVPLLIEALGNESEANPNVTVVVAEALGHLGDGRAREPLQGVLERGASIDVLVAAARALGELGDLRAVHVLKPLLEGRAPVLRRAAAESLGALSAPVADLNERVTRLVAAEDWDGLVRLGPPALPTMIERLPREMEPHQAGLVRALGRIGEPSCSAVVLDWLFAHPILVTTREELSDWTESMKALFGERSKLVLSLACACRRKKKDLGNRYYDRYDWIYDRRWMNEALKRLEEDEDPLAVELLRRVARKADGLVEGGWWETELSAGASEIRLSFARQRARARRALEGRGLAPVDS